MENKKMVSLMIMIITVIISMLIVCSEKSYAAEILPTADQYMELKLVSTQQVGGTGKQAILELWAYNLDFKGVDLRFSYDNTKLTTSNITTNVATTGTDCFAFENGFGGFLSMFQVAETQENVLRYVISLNPTINGEGNISYVSTNSYLQTDETTGDYVSSTDGVLIGKLSFLLAEGEELNNTTFALKTSETNSPLTGVKIAKTSQDYYSNQSIFKFTTITTGTVSGKVTTSSSGGIHTAAVKAYPAGTINWSTMTSHTNLDEITPSGTVTTNNDGTYSLELTQGTYDILLDKDGYLDHIYTNVEVVRNTDVALGTKALVAGDANKDGYIKLEDLSLFNQNYGRDNTLQTYNIKYDYNEDGYIKLEDLSIFNQHYSLVRQIEEKGE